MRVRSRSGLKISFALKSSTLAAFANRVLDNQDREGGRRNTRGQRHTDDIQGYYLLKRDHADPVVRFETSSQVVVECIYLFIDSRGREDILNRFPE